MPYDWLTPVGVVIGLSAALGLAVRNWVMLRPEVREKRSQVRFTEVQAMAATVKMVTKDRDEVRALLTEVRAELLVCEQERQALATELLALKRRVDALDGNGYS